MNKLPMIGLISLTLLLGLSSYQIIQLNDQIQVLEDSNEELRRYTGNPFGTELWAGQIQSENITGMHWYTYLDGSLENRTDVLSYPTYSGTQICADNEDIAHGLGEVPSFISVTPMNDTYDSVAVIATVDWSNVDATNIQVGLYWVNGTTISDDVILVSWGARYVP